MKKFIAVTLLATTATVASAFDYKINVEGRADFVNANVKTTPNGGATTTEKYNNFSNHLIRLNMMGSINESLSYRFRYRFIKTPANPLTGTRENADTGVDYLFVDHKNSLFTARLGKHNWGGAPYGREGIVSGTDVFLLSQAAANYKTGFGSDYRFGATAMFKFMDTNTLDIGISNPNATFTDTTGAEEKNTGLAYTAVYMGSFLNKMVQPVLSYSLAEQDGDTDATLKTKKSNNTMWNAGLRSELAGFVLDVDYKQFKKADRNSGTNTTAGNKEQKAKSIYANAAYAIGDFTPMATYINDKYETADTVTAANANYKRNSFAVGTYWKPMADVNFRYHLMYTNAVTKYDGAIATNSKIKDNKIYLGFKADI